MRLRYSHLAKSMHQLYSKERCELSPINYLSCLWYLDDILVCSLNEEEQLIISL